MPKGINNWREAFWTAILLAWAGVHVAMLTGIMEMDAVLALMGTEFIILGLMVHVVWLNVIRPSRVT